MKRIKHIILSALMLFSVSVAALPAPAVLAVTAKDEVCKGLGSCDNGGTDIDEIIGIIVNILSVVVGIAAVIMIIVAGLKYVTSGGDSSSIASAKSTIIYAIVGLVIAALAQFIVRFVLTNTK